MLAIYVQNVYLCSRKGKTSPFCSIHMIADYYVIRSARFEEGWTQKELAEKAGVCLTVVLKAERGASISAVSNGKIRKALGLERRVK